MAITKTYTIATGNVAELVEIFGTSYQAEIDGVPNPQNKANFASETFDKEILNYVRRRVFDYRKQQLMQQMNDADIIVVGLMSETSLKSANLNIVQSKEINKAPYTMLGRLYNSVKSKLKI